MQAAFRQVFERWGLPARIRVDNGAPWGSSSDLPPALALWWLGLGVEVVWNPPARPQANGHVERWHGVLGPWGEPERCADLAGWQARVGWVALVHRERYPAVAGRSRAAAYPALQRGGRPYRAAQEPAAWRLERVAAALARGVWERRVSKVGRVSLYNREYGVGRAFAGQAVWVRFDAAAHAWVIRDAAGREVARHPAAEITAARIRALEVSAAARRPPPAGRHNPLADPAAQPYGA